MTTSPSEDILGVLVVPRTAAEKATRATKTSHRGGRDTRGETAGAPGARGSTDSNYSMKITMLLQHEGVSIDLINAIPDDAQISSEIDAFTDEATVISQQPSENCNDEPLKNPKPQDHTERCEVSNELHDSSSLHGAIVDDTVSDDRDNLDVFKELEIVARSIQAARLKVMTADEDQDHGDLPDLIDFEIAVHRDGEVLPPSANRSPEHYVESMAKSPQEKEQELTIDSSLNTMEPSMNALHEADFSTAGPSMDALRDADFPNDADTTVPLKESPDARNPRGLRGRSDSSDTLDSWVPPEKFSDRRKQRELCKPTPEKVSKWRNMLSKSQYVSSWARKRQSVDQSQASGSNVPVPADALDDVRVCEDALNVGKSRQSLNASLGSNSPTEILEIEQLQDTMNPASPLSGKVDGSNQDVLCNNRQNLSVPAEVPADKTKNCNVEGEDDDVDPEEIQGATLPKDDAFEDANYYQQPEFSIESVETSFLDDESTVVSYLEDEGDEDSQGDKCSALTLFLGDFLFEAKERIN